MGQTCKSPSCFFESKQKTNYEEKKEKIKATRFHKQNRKQIFCKIKRIMQSGNSLQNLNCNIFPRSLEQKKPIKGHKHQVERERAS